MKTETLSEFVVLAKRLNFTTAAKELYVSQPRLSSHIKALEDELGFELFMRYSKGIALSPAGLVFLESAQKALALLQEAQTHALETATCGTPVAVCGEPLIEPYQKALMKIKPPRFVFIDPPEEKPLFAALDEDIIDVCNFFDYRDIPPIRKEAEEKGLDFILTGRGTMRINVMANHPLAAKDRLTRADLKGLKVVIIRGAYFDTWPLLLEKVFGTDLEMEFTLNQVRGTQNVSLLDLGDKAHICSNPEMEARFSARDDVVTFDRIDGEEITFPDGFVFKKGNDKAREFVQALQRNMDA